MSAAVAPRASAPIAPVAVQPLRCTSCGAHLALGQARFATCPYCRAETPIPESYSALQRAANGFAADKKLAEALYGKIGRPPTRMAMFLLRGAEKSTSFGALVGMILVTAVAGHPLIGVAFMSVVAYLLGYPVAMLLRAGHWIVGRPHPEPFSPYFIVPLALVGAVLFFGIPTVLLKKERELSEVRKNIHGSLAAALPERPGGPSLCRNCGGALDVPPGALGVPCTYCRADNLVALPATWVNRIRATELQAFLRIDGALEAFRLASERARETMWRGAFYLVLLVPVTLFCAYLLELAHISF